MKKIILALGALALLTFAGCDMRAPLKVGYEAPPDAATEVDSVIYGFCGYQSTQDKLQLITSTDDTLYIDVSEARKKGKVLNGYSKGDELYVVPTTDRSVALMTINKNHLLGQWVMPSPYDGSSPSGIILKDGGEAENYEQQGDIVYKSWNIINGHLQLTTTREGTDLFETQTYEITRMTLDSLYLKNIADPSETFEYGRYKPEPELDLGVDFDYNSQEEYDLF
jgi:hypothetical protein